MIRYPCPFCQTNLKAPERKAGAHATCPSCKQRSLVPTSGSVSGGSSPVTSDPERRAGDREPRPGATPARGAGERVAAFVAGMSIRVKLALSLVGLAALVCFVLLPFAGPSPSAVEEGERSSIAQHVLVVAGCLAVVAWLVMLHGYGSSCPSCGRWWAKKDTGSDLADSDTYSRDDADGKAGPDEPSDRAAGGKKGALRVVTYHHKHECTHCGHEWITTQVDEYRTMAGRPRDPAAESKKPRRRHSID